MPTENFTEIRPSAVQGRGIFATKDISAGSFLVARSRPSIGVLDVPRLADTCSNCFNVGQSAAVSSASEGNEAKVKACSSCKLLKFCGKKCQAEAWKRFHKFECPEFTAANVGRSRELPNAVRAVVQILAMRKNGGLSETVWLELLKLQSHLEQVKATSLERRIEVQVLSRGAWNFSQSYNVIPGELAEHIFTMVLTNALTLTTPVFDPLGIIVDPLACTANHSCDPNAVVVFEGPAFSFRALKPIRKDEEIFTSYVDNTNPFALRQRELKERYFFTCKCAKCVRGPTVREDAWAKPASALPEKWKETCRSLGASDKALQSEAANLATGPDEDSKLLAILQSFAFAHLDKGHHAPSPSAALPIYEAGLRICADSTMFPPTRQPYPMLRHEFALAQLQLGNYAAAWLHGVKTYFDIDPVLYPVPHHPLRVVHNYTLANLTLLVSVEPEEPGGAVQRARAAGVDFGVVLCGLLTEVLGNVGASHGVDSAFAKGVKQKMEQVRTDMTRADAGAVRRMERKEVMEDQWKKLRAVIGWLDV